jgi:hypothetical protein
MLQPSSARPKAGAEGCKFNSGRTHERTQATLMYASAMVGLRAMAEIYRRAAPSMSPAPRLVDAWRKRSSAMVSQPRGGRAGVLWGVLVWHARGTQGHRGCEAQKTKDLSPLAHATGARIRAHSHEAHECRHLAFQSRVKSSNPSLRNTGRTGPTAGTAHHAEAAARQWMGSCQETRQ